jgi:hypothetical protein
VVLVLGLAGVFYYLYKASYEPTVVLTPPPINPPVASPSEPNESVNLESADATVVASATNKGLIFAPKPAPANLSDSLSSNVTDNQESNSASDNQLVESAGVLADNLAKTTLPVGEVDQVEDEGASSKLSVPLAPNAEMTPEPEAAAVDEAPIDGTVVEVSPIGGGASNAPSVELDSSGPVDETLSQDVQLSPQPSSVETESARGDLDVRSDSAGTSATVVVPTPRPSDAGEWPQESTPELKSEKKVEPSPVKSEKTKEEAASAPKPKTSSEPSAVPKSRAVVSPPQSSSAPKPLNISLEPLSQSQTTDVATGGDAAKPSSDNVSFYNVPSDDEAIASVWVSNLHSTPDEAESDQVWRKLEGLVGSGRLYRYDTTVGGIKQRRIRLGFFPTKAEAAAAGSRLANDAKLSSSPWLVQPTQAEYKKYFGQSLSDFWVVNISSTPNQEDSEKVWRALAGTKAADYLKKLKSKGSLAPKIYRSETTVNGQLHYRIRLGFFANQKEAEAAGQDLVAAAGLGSALIGQPWAVRPTVDEEKANR